MNAIGPLLLASALAAAGSLVVAWKLSRAWLALWTAAATSAGLAAVIVLAGGGAWDGRAEFGIGGEPLRLRLDAVSAFFLVLLAVLAIAGAWYAREYWSDTRHPRSAPAGRMWWVLLVAGMAFVLLAANGLHFLIGWEIYAVSAYFLITLERQRRVVRNAGWLYLVASHAGTLCLFAFFASLAAKTGSWELGPMRAAGPANEALQPLFWLALAGFGLKAGVFPLHIWLPSAHANAPSHVSALLSGVTIKMGIYGLVRFSGWLPVPTAAGWTLVLLGAASAVLGVAFALGQHDLKRLLAYHSVENIGIILLGVGFAVVARSDGEAAWAQLALAGGLLHVWNHGLFKALLFLGAGSVLHATGTREMSRLGGLWRRMPWTTGTFALGAAAIAGLPPLNGFVSEWLVLLGLFEATATADRLAWAAVPAAMLLGITGALALACFVKVCGVVFLGLPRSRHVERAHECGLRMRLPMLALAVACVLIGVAPVAFWPAVARAAAAWRGENTVAAVPAALAALGAWQVTLALLAGLAALALFQRVRKNGVARAVTWDCGYASPNPRMQYTAGSFAATITEWFAWILRPRRHVMRPVGLFPTHAVHAQHTPETVLEYVMAPAGRALLLLAAGVRRLQHGRLQFYILYLLAGMAALAAIALTGGAR